MPSDVENRRWQAVADRDPAGAGYFLYAVRTTGVFCRPGCGSRLPGRGNVEFFDDAAAAQAAGYRPCRRCRPEATSLPEEWTQLAAKACRMLEESAVPLSNEQLAGAAGLSSSHFQRIFKRVTGMTPKAYAASARVSRVGERLAGGETVTDALYGAGFGSSGRFYDGSTQLLGMTPAQYRRGAGGVRIGYGVTRCSLGFVLAAATDRGVCAVSLGDVPEDLLEQLRLRFPGADLSPAGPGFAETLQAVVKLVESPASGFELPLDVRGTVFQRQVWDALRRIPAGSTATYAEIAQAVGRPAAARAVAAACAANPVAVAIPCHRVLRGDRTLSGYRWGVERKAELLRREAQG
ncbi:MAG TPA: bifunctional DNA-binding transcriptional regulator/O6-methylguanine-DNA methyltransferase Ada [Actinomycetota bacterium]|nr:bifunctional DNA-binding transcriptional regulator/O6-methylguanine-DNA methyltransferase Ada [Actinomycetota bacterium]